MDYLQRKAARKEYFDRYISGWKEVDCTACSGSGCYDDNGSPPCDSCKGTGREKISPEKYQEAITYCQEQNMPHPFLKGK